MAENNKISTTSKVQECFQKLMEDAKKKTNLSEIFEKAEAIADEHNLQLPEKPASWIMDTLDSVDKVRVLEEWLLQASSKKSAEEIRIDKLTNAFDEFCAKHQTSPEEISMIVMHHP